MLGSSDVTVGQRFPSSLIAFRKGRKSVSISFNPVFIVIAREQISALPHARHVEHMHRFELGCNEGRTCVVRCFPDAVRST